MLQIVTRRHAMRLSPSITAIRPPASFLSSIPLKSWKDIASGGSPPTCNLPTTTTPPFAYNITSRNARPSILFGGIDIKRHFNPSFLCPSLSSMHMQTRFFSRKTGSSALEPSLRPLSKKQLKRKRKRAEMRALKVDPKADRIKKEFMRKQFGSAKTKDYIDKTGKG